MRHLGTLPTEDDARHLSDHLEGLGMTTRVEPEQDRWAIWIYHEDHLPQARQEFAAYEKDPADPRFRDAAKAAQAARKESDRLERDYRKRVRDMRGRWDGVNFHGRPVTITLIAICILVFIGQQLPGWGREVRDKLLLTRVTIDEHGQHSQQLRGIDQGELWRLVTPIFLHFGIPHIVFNMWALLYFGTVIEYCRSGRTLLFIVLVSAVLSNLIQYAFMVQTHSMASGFGGMSGVVYALFGYVWMKSRYEPEQGMYIHPRSVQSMLVWLFICIGITPVLPIANAAHFGGLVVGVALALARF